MNHHDEAIANAPRIDLPKYQERAAWLEWVNCWYPHDPREEVALRTRMPDEKPAPQSPEELSDLSGLIDREMAWFLARAWFVIRHREQRRRSAATRMSTPAAQQTRDDLFSALDGDDYDRAGGYQ